MVMTAVCNFAIVRGLSPSMTRQLQNPAVLLSELCVPAESTTTGSPSSTKSFEVRNPASPETILATLPVMDMNDARMAIERSHDALESWRDGTTAAYRANLLHKWSQLILQHANDIATIMTLESGKPIRESRSEIEYGRSFLDYYAAEAVRPTNAGFLVPTPFAETGTGKPRGQIMAIYQAVGVAALITPWNFPIAMVRSLWNDGSQ
jgi:succinate-semialdehyde dehydrogenase/glutarate-semialdehyde dehydrogenase